MNILYLSNRMDVGGVEKCIIKLATLFSCEYKVIVVTCNGDLVKELKRLGIKHYQIENAENKNLKTILKNIWIISNVVKKENIQLIHSHHRMTTLYAKIICKFKKIHLVHTQHLCINDKFKLTKLTLQNVLTVTVSNSAKEILVEKCGLDNKNIVTIYNTIDENKTNNSVSDKLLKFKSKNYFIVAQISRIVDYKGVYDFIDIAEITMKKNHNIRFLLIGDGPEYEKVSNYINKKQLDEYVLLLGNKTNIIDYLQYIDLLLLCSYIEGLPLTPLEAFSQSVPVVATNINGTNEEIINDYNGYLIEPKNIEVFSEKIVNIAENEILFQSFRENAKKTFDEKFNSQLYYSEHKKIYSDFFTN